LTRLQSAFAKGPALVTFVTGGDGPTAEILDALVAGSADVSELGMPKDSIILVNLCGRSDKGIFSVAEHLGVEL
jgi:tryptophan synthase alpha subunit